MDYSIFKFNKIKIFNSLIGNSKTKIPLSEEMISRKNARRSIVVKNLFKRGKDFRKKINCKKTELEFTNVLEKILGKSNKKS